MTEFISRNYGNEGYEIIIKTDSHDHYRATEEFARRLIDHAKPMRNADRIRAMSDEELATFISEIADECERNTECNQHCYGCDIEYCVRESCLKWLQQPAEEGKHD